MLRNRGGLKDRAVKCGERSFIQNSTNLTMQVRFEKKEIKKAAYRVDLALLARKRCVLYMRSQLRIRYATFYDMV